MKTKRRTIGIICLAIIMMVSCCGLLMDNMYKGVSAGAAEQAEESLFEIQNGMIINYKGDTTGTVEIPSSINGETVQGLATNSFRSKLLTEVVIPETVTTISARAFFDCKMLQTITWKSGTASLSIAAGAFNRCSSLEGITLPARATNVSATAFVTCNSLSNIYVEEGNTVYKNGTNGYEGVVFLTTATDVQSKDAAYIWPAGKKPYKVQHIIGMAGYEVETVIGPAGYTYTLPQEVGPYEVEGWYTKSDYSSGKLEETYTIAETERDVYTIYARLSDGISEQAYISFDAQGGNLSATVSNPCPVEDDTDYTVYIPQRDGYDFSGWYTLPAKQGVKVIDAQGVLLQQGTLTSQTLYAGWTAQRYTIKFNEYDGSLVSTVTADYGDAIEVVIREREGYTFLGWCTEPEVDEMTSRLTDYKGEFLPGTWEEVYEKSTDNTMNVYAQYTANQYHVTFECTYCGKQVIQEVYYDDTLVLPEICIHAGYRLNGWSETSGGVLKHAESTIKWTYASDKTLYTVWATEVYDITYKDGNTVITNSGNPASYTVEDSITFKEYAPTGYNFENWLDEEGNVVTGIAKGSTGDRVIYLEKEAKTVTIKLDYRGAYNEETKHVDYGEEFTLPDKALGDYPEIEWKDTATDNTYSANTEITVDFTEERTYQAIWTAAVTLHYPEDETELTYLTYGEDFELPVDERAGWIFRGWAKTEEGNVFVTDENGESLAPFDMTENFHLHAIYEGEKLTVTLEKEGGMGGSSQIEVQVGAPLPAVDTEGNLLTKPSLTGQTFLGYYTEKEGNGEPIYDNEMHSVATEWKDYYPTKIYAAWEDTVYDVTLNTENEDGEVIKFGTVSVTYLNYLPDLDEIPELLGHKFTGFYDSEGDQYYDEKMHGGIWDKLSGGALYAEFEPVEYEVTLIADIGVTEYKTVITAVYGEKMPLPNGMDEAPVKTGFEFVGYFSDDGVKYYGMQIVKKYEYQYNMGLEWGGYYEALNPIREWDQASDGELYAEFKRLECDYTYNNIWLNNGYLSPSSTIHIKHGIETDVEARSFEDKGLKFLYFICGLEEDAKNPLPYTFQLKRYRVDGKIGPTNEIAAVYQENECIAAGTLITLADGRQVPVESLTGNEELLVWNLLTGKLDTAPMVFIDSDPAAMYKVINLYFSDGTQVKVISEHAFWDLNLNRYVYLREDAAQYIGHWFNKQGANGWTKVQLIDVVVQEEYTTAWSPVTYGHLCYFVNGMLSIPGGIEGLFNIFEVDPETMMYDMEQMQADIAQYGLYTYEEFAAIFPIPEEIFDAFNAQYFKVAIGKGMLTLERVGQLIERYAEFF